jgi:hypothetical protein
MAVPCVIATIFIAAVQFIKREKDRSMNKKNLAKAAV